MYTLGTSFASYLSSEMFPNELFCKNMVGLDNFKVV